jgi:uncharacterized membrane protein
MFSAFFIALCTALFCQTGRFASIPLPDNFIHLLDTPLLCHGWAGLKLSLGLMEKRERQAFGACLFC